MQEQPKNCIIDPYKLNGPVAVFTDGAPANALEYTKVGSMLSSKWAKLYVNESS